MGTYLAIYSGIFFLAACAFCFFAYRATPGGAGRIFMGLVFLVVLSGLGYAYFAMVLPALLGQAPG